MLFGGDRRNNVSKQKRRGMNKKINALIVGVVAAIVGLAIWIPQANAACDNVAIIRCGVNSHQQLVDKYTENARHTQTVYSAFGISASDLSGFTEGTVYKDGRVVVDGETVATNAVTAGYNWGEGDPNRKQIAGTDAYMYSTSQLTSDARRSMVKMVDGKFKFAVIYDCGNPVKATPKPTPPPVKEIRVCDLTTRKIVTIKESDFDETKHSKDLDDCKDKEAPKPVQSYIKVCDITTNTLVRIKESDFDDTRHTKDLTECDDIKVCRIADKSIVIIARNDMSDKYTTDLDTCKEEPPVVPVSAPAQPKKTAPVQELPATGVADAVSGSLGIGSVAGAGYYYLASRRALGK